MPKTIDYSQNRNKKFIGELQMSNRLLGIICSCLPGGPTSKMPISRLSEIRFERFKKYRGVGPVTVEDFKALMDSVGMEVR